MASTINRYEVTKQGGPFALVTVPTTSPAAHEVSIRIKTIGLNPLDWKRLYHGMMVESWPAVFGAEGAGVVEAVGPGVTKFKAGDEVFFGSYGGGDKAAAFQEVAVLREMEVAKKPRNVTFEEAASLAIGYTTALAAVYDSLKIPLPFLQGGATDGTQPKSVLVLGGSSAVGASAIQLLGLALRSATILATSSVQHHAHLVSLGASKAFDQKSSTLVANIKSATPNGRGVDMIIDAVNSGATETAIFDTLCADGPKEYTDVLTGAQFDTPEGVKRYPTLGFRTFASPGGANAMSALSELVSEGKYKVPVKVITVGTGFEVIAKGLEELKAGVSGTKLVVAI